MTINSPDGSDLQSAVSVERVFAPSPSLGPKRDGGGPAYEVKFLLEEELAADVERWARNHLAPDQFANPALGGAYRTTSLYTDTPQADVYFRSPRYKRRKFRVRRYGGEGWVFLERKNKAGDRVAKRRERVPVGDLQLLSPPQSAADWAGTWFHQRLFARQLRPACLVGYERTAYHGGGDEGPLRLTMDRNVRGLPWDRWEFEPLVGGKPLFGDRVILELKFRLALPGPFKKLVADMGLQAGPVSKYRACRETFGVPLRRHEGEA